jgi:ATP-dependent DNA helicase PIF1
MLRCVLFRGPRLAPTSPSPVSLCATGWALVASRTGAAESEPAAAELSPKPSHKIARVKPARRTAIARLIQQGALHREAPQAASMSERSDEQRAVVDFAKTSGRNVFVTGVAGSGKSLTLRAIIQCLDPATTRVAAPTGVAALNVGGMTLHSLFGLRPGEEAEASPMSTRFGRRKSRRHFLPTTTALVIDEVSMVSPDLLEAVDRCCREVRTAPDRPFGGVQLVVCGDFLQLPPVERAPLETMAAAPSAQRYCFQSDAWRRADFQRFDLGHSYRHDRDADFARFLSAARVGRPDVGFISRSLAVRRTHQVAPAAAPDGDAVFIRATNTEVDRINKARFDALTESNRAEEAARVAGAAPSAVAGDEHQALNFTATFTAIGTGVCKDASRDGTVQRALPLQRGTKVMLLRNLNVALGLVNGRIGTVVGFERAAASLLGAPGFDTLAPAGVLPVVDFPGNPPRVLGPSVWEVRAGDNVVGTLTQLPLRHAWAITAHKSQGLTLDNVEVDLRRFFEPGQAYVALSRARSADTLRVVNHASAGRVIRACPVALAFQHGVDEAGATASVSASDTPCQK